MAGAADLHWTAIHWVSQKIGDRAIEHAALMIPVHVEGAREEAIMQLDLGSDRTTISGAAYRHLCGDGALAPDAKQVRLSAAIGDYRLRDFPINLARKDSDTVDKDGASVFLGTLGADFFATRMLLLDFAAQRFCIPQNAALPPDFEKRISFVPLAQKGGKLFVPLTINGREETGFFFDTGASLFALSTTRSEWRALTGRTGDEKENAVWSVPSWGKAITLIGAPIRGTIRLGSASLERPVIFFERDGVEKDFGFENWPFPDFPVRGLFGNELFRDRYVVVVDIPGNRFGLLDPALLQLPN